MDFADKVVVVTGGGNGIGRQVVLGLLRRGARVAAVDIRDESLRETAALGGDDDRLTTHRVDITDRAATAALPEAVIAAHGAVDAVINVAGIIQPFVRLNDLDYEVIERVINVNLYGTIHMVKAFLPHLLHRPIAHIANVSSMGGFHPVPGQTIYGASKAAVKLLTEGLYAELLDTDVGVSVIMPGAVGTEITANSGVEIPSMGEVDQSKIRTTSSEEARRDHPRRDRGRRPAHLCRAGFEDDEPADPCRPPSGDPPHLSPDERLAVTLTDAITFTRRPEIRAMGPRGHRSS